MDFTTQVLVWCHREKGGTFDFARQGVVVYERGYIVSVAGGEEVKLLTAEAVDNFVRDNGLDELRTVAYLGVWFDEEQNVWCLDVSYHFNNQALAERFGRENGQRAIWSCADNKEIRL